MTHTAYVVNHSISWAAHHLIDSHGGTAAQVAAIQARRMVAEGRFELATMWELVQDAAGELLGEPAQTTRIVH